MLHVRKKDKVLVLAGKDKGKRGEIIEIDRGGSRALISKVNFSKKHARPTQTEAGGIREKEAYMPLSKVMLVCPKCSQPTRSKFDVLTDGTKTRVCRRCGEMIV
ncbi:MAG: 50S ribosomal protein L24 [Elusimicrobiota bacterium]|jgi:large subunit ribosomal protein L24